MAEFRESDRLVDLEIDDGDGPPIPIDLEQERRVAVFDLLEHNRFRLAGTAAGPHRLRVAGAPDGWRLDATAADGALTPVGLAAEALAPLMEDYLALCETYRDAVRSLAPSQIEAVEQARRALHLEASAMLRQCLTGRIEMDEETARRLFTVLCAAGPPGGR